MYFVRILSLLCCLFCFSSGIAVEQDQGTLIVSYSTGERAERLNRIRFSLISEDNEEQMYPKGDAFVESSDSESRMIVIENLAAGNYKLRFLVPNSDELFEATPEKNIVIVKDDILRVDQLLNPRYSTIKVKTELLTDEFIPNTTPSITLEDDHGNIRAHSVTGKLIAHYLIPGSYTIKFGEIDGFHTPEGYSMEINPGHVIGPLVGTYIWEGHSQEKKESKHIAASYIERRPSGVVVINQFNAQLTVTSNFPHARWTLLKNNVAVYEGVGSVINFQVSEGDNYQVVAEPLKGYVVRVSPSLIFNLYPADSMRVSIAYERSSSSFSIQAPFPAGETLSFTVKSREVPPATYSVKSSAGKVFWQSKPLPTGHYEISYSLPPKFLETAPDRIQLRIGEKIQLSPKFVIKSALRVIANIPDAIFILTTQSGSQQVWKGEGREFSFTDLPAGSYKLAFSTQNPDYYIPPKEMKIFYNNGENKDINVYFQISGKLTIKTNVDRSHAVIQEIGGQQKTYEENILKHSRSFNLPEGRYRITLTTFPEDSNTTANLFPPDPVDVRIKALNSEDINLSFRVSNMPIEKQRKVNINAGISSAGFTIYKLNEKGKEPVGHYSGKNIKVTLPSSNLYEVIFDDVPNFQKPENSTFEVKAGEEKNIPAVYVPFISIIDIPEGRAIIGDGSSEELINELPGKIVTLNAFSIGAYEITNAEFSAWLNIAIKSGTIAYIKEADKRGQVVNLRGQLLFKCFEADSFSQISAQLHSTDTPAFMPLAGKDSYPLVNVTWYGALEYCKDNHFRLPTEAEWEKAAGMQPESQGKGLKKFRFGFGRNEIDHTWANYKDNNDHIQHFKVLTTPVGYYNGVNSLPLRMNVNSQQQTNLAKSPYGAFDMSGNVWEWVADWYDDAYHAKMTDTDPKGPSSGTQKVVKGGCYDSLADGVRVSERMGLPPDYCDAYTGFRIAR
ncbi:MAG TPA: SUMF1/EgtB/PvdO family nonheme iron enzyme [Parachlamydiaceae bacterium]|nr:SUMF1/EgtB/PvdO family nonheme iron enzyme [Parachlamydiaceae bacterium]